MQLYLQSKQCLEQSGAPTWEADQFPTLVVRLWQPPGFCLPGRRLTYRSQPRSPGRREAMEEKAFWDHPFNQINKYWWSTLLGILGTLKMNKILLPSRHKEVCILRKGNPPTLLVGMNASWWTSVENSMEIPRELKVELPCDLVIPLLGIYPDKTIIQKHTRTSVFISALFSCQDKEENLNIHQQMSE